MPPVHVRRLALDQTADAEALLALLDHYARDPMGGGQPLPAQARSRLVQGLRERPDYAGWLAWPEPGEQRSAVGLVNTFEGYSTFAARPLLNIHDLVVHQSARGQGVGRALLQAVQEEATRRGCCKLTLEVLSNNQVARAAYQRFGFAAYELDSAAGHALFLEKKLPGGM